MSNKIQFIQLEDGTQQISETGIITFDAGSILRVDTSTISNSLDVVNVEYLTNNSSSLYTQDDALAGNRTVDLNGNDLTFNGNAGLNINNASVNNAKALLSLSKAMSNNDTRSTYIEGSEDGATTNYWKIFQKGSSNFFGNNGIGFYLSNTLSHGTEYTMTGISGVNHALTISNYTNSTPRMTLYGGTTNVTGNGYLKFWNYNAGSLKIQIARSGKNFINPDAVGGISDAGFIVMGDTYVGTEKISLQDDTLITKKLELSTTTDGMLMPRLTTAQMNAISTPDTHLLIFNTDLNALYRWNGTAWVAMSAGYGIIEVKDSSGNPTFYADLPTAFTAAGSGGVITLHSNITVASQCTMPGSVNATFTINGNGYAITHTANTGSEFYLVHTGSGQNKILYLNDVKIVSNGTATGASTAAIFAPQPGSGSMNIKANSGTFVSSINNPCAYLINITGGNWTSTNSFVNFSGEMRDAVITVKSGRGSFINCDITIVSGGQIGLLGNLIDCTITGDATGNDMIYSKLNQKIHGCTITCTSGANSAIAYNGGVTWTLANPTPLRDTKVYYSGTDPYAVKATYIASIKDVYIYSENTTCLYAQNTTQTGGYNLENVVLETNSTNRTAFYRLDSGSFRMKNVSATCFNNTNTEEAFDIRVSGTNELYMEDCTANINNPTADNVLLTNSSITTGGAYIYGLTMSKIGAGLNLNTVPLLNINTRDAYGNIQIG